MTAEQARVGELARQHIDTHLSRRRVLTMDEFAEMKDVRPRMEKEMRLPGDSRGRSKVYFFSIDGTLRGEHLSGCLMAGECILVQATNFEKALKLAKDGLHETIELALTYFKEDQGRLVYAAPTDTVKVEVGGGRLHDVPKQPDLETDPKLRRMIETVIGRKPWKG